MSGTRANVLSLLSYLHLFKSMIWIPRCEKQIAWKVHHGIDQHQKKSHGRQKSGEDTPVDKRHRSQLLNNLLSECRVELIEHTHILDDELIPIRMREIREKSDIPDK